MTIISTQRLNISSFTYDDVPFIIELLNEPDFYRFIGDKNVRTIEQAKQYLTTGPMKSMEEHGFALMKVATKSGQTIGMCGLLKREEYDYPDIGYAFLKQFYRQGYGFESVKATLEHFKDIRPLLALTNTDNTASQQLLLKAGFVAQKGISPESNTKIFQLFR